MINPQSINISDLPSLPLEWKNGLPSCSGIYFVVNLNKEILYIGRSNNIRNRWQYHHRYHQLEHLENIRITWIELSDNVLLPEIEKALINYFNPVFNNQRINAAKHQKTSVKTDLSKVIGLKFSDWLILQRRKNNLTQDDLAKGIGVTKQSVSNWERRESEPTLSIKQVKIFCELLNCSFEEIPIDED